MRSLFLLLGLALVCACPSAPVPPPGDDAGTSTVPPTVLPTDHRPPSRVDRPPSGQGLPDELKPPGH